MANIEPPQSTKDLPTALIKNMIALSTSGFGLVVALAWNEVIKSAVETYINPYLGQGSGVISLLVYAIVITALAVIMTMQLTNVQRKIESLSELKEKRRQQRKKKK